MADTKANPYERSVVLEGVAGEKTGRDYPGTFRVRVVLSQNQLLRRGQIYRDLLGAHSGSAGLDEQVAADRLADLAVRVCDAPQWWTEANNGLDLLDNAPLTALARKVQTAVDEFEAEVRQRAEKAKAELKSR